MSDSHAADVQAELQQYLNSKNINALMITLVESLLIEKPSNPIGFIIDYLVKQYPDQAKDAVEAISAQAVSKVTAQLALDAKADSSKNKIKPESTKLPLPAVAVEPAMQPEDDSDDDDDDMEDLPVPSASQTQHLTGRRKSVSAESTDPAKLRDQISNISIIPKSPEVAEDLSRVVGKSLLLRTLDPDQKDFIIKAFAGPLFKPAGEDIIVQGDIGDVFYLLEEGTVDVFVSKGGQDPAKVHTYTRGDSFGELAILYNTPRAATCRAQTDCKLWTLDRVSFKAIVVAAAMIKRETFQAFLEQVPLLQSLSPLEIMTLADSLAEEKYVDGDTVCREGDKGDYFYIIREGSVTISQRDGADEGIIGELTVGDYFGEIALLTTKTRQATVRANGALSVLAIDRATFTRVFGTLEAILKRNIDKYVKFKASTI